MDALQQEAASANRHQLLAVQQELRIKKKADKQKDADTAFKEWTKMVTLDSIVLSEDLGTIVSVDSKPVEALNVKYIRAFCSKLKITGYKNRRRDEMVRLLWERKKNELVERRHYAVARVSAADNDDDDNSYVDLQSAKQNCQTEPEDVDDDDKMPAVSSPVTRSIAAKAAAVAKNKKKRLTVRNSEESSASSKKAKMCKSTVPSVVTTDGTYYRAINVWFDERNRTDIVNMGSSPSIQELDARKKFKNKTTYDKLLVTYLDDSVDNNAVNFIGFDNEYLNDCGIADQYASDFDFLTSEELCNVLDYVVHWYNVSYRNNKTSGTEPRIVFPISCSICCSHSGIIAPSNRKSR